MEGAARRTQWPTATRHQLLGDVCAGCHLANHTLLLRAGNHQGLVNLPNRLHIRIHSSPSRGSIVHEVRSRIQ